MSAALTKWLGGVLYYLVDRPCIPDFYEGQWDRRLNGYVLSALDNCDVCWKTMHETEVYRESDLYTRKVVHHPDEYSLRNTEYIDSGDIDTRWMTTNKSPLCDYWTNVSCYTVSDLTPDLSYGQTTDRLPTYSGWDVETESIRTSVWFTFSYQYWFERNGYPFAYPADDGSLMQYISATRISSITKYEYDLYYERSAPSWHPPSGARNHSYYDSNISWDKGYDVTGRDHTSNLVSRRHTYQVRKTQFDF